MLICLRVINYISMEIWRLIVWVSYKCVLHCVTFSTYITHNLDLHHRNCRSIYAFGMLFWYSCFFIHMLCHVNVSRCLEDLTVSVVSRKSAVLHNKIKLFTLGFLNVMFSMMIVRYKWVLFKYFSKLYNLLNNCRTIFACTKNIPGK